MLVEAARRQKLLYYGDIQNSLGGRGYVGQVLDEMNTREHAKGRPLLSAIAVSKSTERPSGAFGLSVAHLKPTAGRDGFWESERDAVWAYDWPSE